MGENESLEYAKAVLLGIWATAMDYVNMVIHPVDTVFYPMSILAYDAAIITAYYNIPFPSASFDPVFRILQQIVAYNPQLYHEATTRMQQRVSSLKLQWNEFENASGPKKVEMATHVTTGILAPGYIFKAVKVAANLHRYGIPSTPPKFVDIYQDRPTLPSAQSVSVSDIRSVTVSEKFLYVLTEKNKLLMTSEYQNVGQGGFRLVGIVHHQEIGRLLPVFAAGECFAKEGKFFKINNNSGRYGSNGPHLKKLVERSFVQAGFSEARGKFVDNFLTVPENLKLDSIGKFSTLSITLPNSALQVIRNTHKENQKKQDNFSRLHTTHYLDHVFKTHSFGTSFLQQKLSFTNNHNHPWNKLLLPKPLSVLDNLTATRDSLSRLTQRDHPFSHTFRKNWKSSMWSEQRTKEEVIKAVNEQYRGGGTFMDAYWQALRELGYPAGFRFTDFKDVLQATGLVASYNKINPNNPIPELSGPYADIGGVATKIGLIEGLENDIEQVLQSPMMLCVKTLDGQMPFTPDEFQQIITETFQMIFIDETIPLVDIRFNENGSLYASMRLQTTLIGEIIGKLDYFLKAVLNGGVIKKEFLDTWFVTQNTNIDYLKSIVLDLKKFCKEKLPDLSYVSLREQLYRLGIELSPDMKDPDPHSIRNVECRSAFRIISTMKQILKQGNTFVIEPDFYVEDSIYTPSEYQSYLEQYQKKQGQYPRDYLDLKNIYHIIASDIKEKMPRMAREYFGRDYFQMLGIINFFCHYFTTLKKMGKVPILPKGCQLKAYRFPTALPPIPVRYYRFYQLNLTLGSIVTLLGEQGQGVLDKYLCQMLERSDISLSKELLTLLNNALQKIITQQVPPEVLTEEKDLIDDTTDILLRKLQYAFKDLLACLKVDCHKALKTLVENFKLDLTSLDDLHSVQEKKQVVLASIQRKYQKDIEKLDKNIEEARKESLAELEKNTQSEINKHMNAIETEKQSRFQKEKEEIEKIRVEIQTAHQGRLKKLDQDILEFQTKDLQALDKETRETTNTVVQKIEQQKVVSISSINAQVAGIPLAKRNQAAITAAISQTSTAHEQAKQRACQEIASQSVKNKQAILEHYVKLKNQKIVEINAAEINSKKLLTENSMLILKEIDEEYEAEKPKVRMAIQLQGEKNRETIQLYYVDERKKGIAAIEKMKTDAENVLHALYEKLEHICVLINQSPEIADANIISHFPYATMEIADAGYYKALGVHTSVIGGCSIELSNIELKSMPIGVDFANRLFPKIQTLLPGELCQVVNGSQHYMAFKLSTDYQAAYHKLDYVKQLPVIGSLGNNEIQTLNALALEELNQDEHIKLPPFDPKARDAGGQTLLHYCARFGTAQAIEKISKNDLTLLSQKDNRKNLPLHEACMNGNFEVVDYILSKQPQFINEKTSNGLTPVMLGAQNGHTDIVKKLISLGANTLCRLPNELYALYLAIQNGHLETALCFIQHTVNQDINFVSKNLDSVLYLACRLKQNAVAIALIQRGADLLWKRRADGYRPFHMAAENGLTEVCLAMLATGKIDVNIPLPSQQTALHLASMQGHLVTVKKLLEKGANGEAQNADGETALFLAIRHGQKEVALHLAESARLDFVNLEGQTASMVAAIFRQFDIADSLIKRGENPQLNSHAGFNYVYYLLQMGQYHRYKNLVLAKKIDPNLIINGMSSLAIAAQSQQALLIDFLRSQKALFISDRNIGWELIHFCVKADHLSYVKECLKTIKDINEMTIKSGKEKGKSLSYIAAENGSLNCLALLLKQSTSKIDNAFGSFHLLFAAIASGKKKIIELVILHMPDVNTLLDQEKNTAAHMAVNLGYSHLLVLLYRRGVNFGIKNKNGFTCMHLAILNDDAHTLKKILKLIPETEWPTDLLALAIERRKEGCIEVLQKNASIQPLSGDCKVDALDKNAQDSQEILEALFEINDEKFKKLLARFPINSALITYKEITQPLLHWAFDQESAWAIRLLLEKNADPFIKDSDNLNLLHKLALYPEGKAKRVFALIKIHLENQIQALFQAESTEGATVLHYATARGSVGLIPLLVNSLDLSYRAQNGDTLLHMAAQLQNIELMRMLLKKELDVNSMNNKRETPLMLAANLGNMAILQLLLQAGADFSNKDIFGNTALHHALFGKKLETAQPLITLMTNFHIKNRDGNTPAMLAAVHGFLPILQVIIKASDAQIIRNKKGWNALHMAAFFGQTNVVTYLINMGFSVDMEQQPKQKSKADKNARLTPLQLAASRGHLETVIELVNSGADLQKRDRFGDTLIEHAIIANQPGMTEFVLQLAMTHQSDTVASVMMAAAKGNNLFIIRELLLQGTNIDIQRADGKTALHIASIYHANQVAILLMEQGSNLEIADSRGNKPIHDAVTHGALHVLKLLCDRGVLLDDMNDEEKTPLFLASEIGNFAAVIQLLKAGADINMADKNNMTPAQIAMQKGFVEIGKLLCVMGDTSLGSKEIEILPKSIKETIVKQKWTLFAIDEALKKADSEEYHLMHLAVLLAQQAGLQLLCLESPNLINLPDIEGNTPLHLAVIQDNLEAIRILMAHKAMLNVQNKQGDSPLALAIIHHKPETYQFLIDCEGWEKKNVEQIKKETAEAYYKIAYDLYTKKDYEKAIIQFNKAIIFDRDLMYGYKYCAWSYYYLRDYQNTVKKLNDALSHKPIHADAHFDLAYYYQSREEHQEAIVHFNEAIRLSPKVNGYYYYRGCSYYELQDYSKALIDFNEAVRCKPDDAKALSMLTQVQEKLKEETQKKSALFNNSKQ